MTNDKWLEIEFVRDSLSFALPPYRQYAEHPQLVLQRLVGRFDDQDQFKKQDQFKIAENDAMRAIKKILFIYKHAFSRYENLFKNQKHTKQFTLAVQTRLAVGLGNESVLETGLTLHHTYGVPIIPGSALKGATAAFCRTHLATVDNCFAENGEYYKILFGTTDENGCIVFHDAWITPDSVRGALRPDVMSIHHKGYYEGRTPPTDFDDPVIVPFLSVKGTFLFAVTCEIAETADDQQKAEADKWADLAADLLKKTLMSEGVGAKRSSGYGIFTE